jgi:hypothetical protein
MGFDPARLAGGLAARLADVETAIERYRAFSFQPDDAAPAAAMAEEDTLQAARELVLRALAAASDPLNHRIMRRLAEGDAALADLAPVCSLPRIAVWERVNDLVQVGLAARALEGDRAGLTPAGLAVVELVDEVARETTESRTKP